MGLYPDISHYHPVSDWNKAKSNCPFLISKATQGTNYIDATLNSFIDGCESNGIPYWLYTYLDKGNEKAQAEFLVKTCKDKVGKYFVGYILDVEADNTASNVQAALDYLNSLEVKTMFYHMYSQYGTYSSIINSRPSNCAWWEARYGANNGIYSSSYPPHSGVDLHQYTSNGVCNGISGNCDLNRICGTKDESWFTNRSSASNTNSANTNETYCYTGIGTAVAKVTVNIRSGAGTHYSSYGTITTGTAVEVLEILSSGWYKIVWPGASCGYAYTSNTTGSYYDYTSKDGSTTTSTSASSSSTNSDYVVGDKVTVNGTIYANGNGSGSTIKKSNATMYVCDLVNSKAYKYYIGVANSKGGTRQGWAEPSILTKF